MYKTNNVILQMNKSVKHSGFLARENERKYRTSGVLVNKVNLTNIFLTRLYILSRLIFNIL